MFIHTDFLRAALYCVADQKDARRYLQGVNVTSTHIQATNGHVFVSMEHGCVVDHEGVFIIHGEIPDTAEGTLFQLINNQWIASHVDEEETLVGHNEVERIEVTFPDLSKLLTSEADPINVLPTFQAKYLALPHLMFGRDTTFVPVQFKSWGKGKPCQLMFDKTLNYMYGNPLLIIMPMTDDTFEKLEQAFDEQSE